jgi:DNA-binding transcriptional ArsR family regulator
MTNAHDDGLWSAIADPSRRRVLDLLVQHGEASASWLAGEVPFSRQAVAKHLVVLEHAGLTSKRKEGREVLHCDNARRLAEAPRAMTNLAKEWDGRLSAIKLVAEEEYAKTKEH